MTNFRKALQKHEMKAATLAALAGVTRQAVQVHVQRGVMTIRIAKRYAAVLGCDPLELLG